MNTNTNVTTNASLNVTTEDSPSREAVTYEDGVQVIRCLDGKVHVWTADGELIGIEPCDGTCGSGQLRNPTREEAVEIFLNTPVPRFDQRFMASYE
jgi:hypothetical protein